MAEELAVELFPGTPAFQVAGTRGQELLESALAQPRWPQHRTLIDKAAALHYSLNKNHCYIDGNKRIAVAAMEWFLHVNSAWLLASNDELIEFTLSVAEGSMSREASAKWLRHRCARADWSERRIVRWLQSLPPLELAAVYEANARGDAALFLDAASVAAGRADARAALADM